jgi:hypothetical protein
MELVEKEAPYLKLELYHTNDFTLGINELGNLECYWIVTSKALAEKIMRLWSELPNLSFNPELYDEFELDVHYRIHSTIWFKVEGHDGLYKFTLENFYITEDVEP